MKEHFLLVLENGKLGHSASAKMHFVVLGDFAFICLQNYTVKLIKNEDSDSQGHAVYISIERIS